VPVCTASLSARKGLMDKQRIFKLALETLANRRAEIELEIEAVTIIRKAAISARAPKAAAARKERKKRKTMN
jgi:hypothetical protein